VGATIRLKFSDRFGPAREIHCGTGYWSQDSFMQVLAAPEPPSQIQVQWPGGTTTTSAFPTGATEIAISTSGIVKVIR
jgi:hypothetical protein